VFPHSDCGTFRTCNDQHVHSRALRSGMFIARFKGVVLCKDRRQLRGAQGAKAVV